MDATAAREAELVNQALREAVLLLQRRCEEHGKVERELRQTCENLRRLLIEKTSQLQQEIEKRKAVEEILRCETKARDGERLATWGAIAALFTHEVANSLNGISGIFARICEGRNQTAGFFVARFSLFHAAPEV